MQLCQARSIGTVQEEGLTNEDRHHLLLLHKQTHHIVGSLPVYINRGGPDKSIITVYPNSNSICFSL